MKLREIAYGGLWAASAVEVAKFTYAAYTATFSAFPGTGSGESLQQNVNQNESSALGMPKNAQGLVDSIEHPLTFPSSTGHGTFGLYGPITQWLRGVLGTDPGKQRTAPPAGKKAPPTALVTAIRRSVNRPGSARTQQAWSNFTRWAYRNGWTRQEVIAYLGRIGISVQ